MATLKISDLSVGDWVRYGGNDYQVKSIHEDPARVTIVGNKEQRDESIYDILPIPITVEIRKKNGKSDEWSTGDWEEIPSTEVSPSCQCMRVRDLGTHIFLGKEVAYVHQLQHALRLAGVDKEINL